MLHDEGGLPELVFYRFFEVQHLQAGQGPGRELVLLFRHAQLLERADQPGRVVHVGAGLGVLEDRFTDGQAREGLRQVHRAALVGHLQAAGGLHGHLADQRLGEVHQVQVVPVRRVELHHGELGVVAHRDAFVAVAAVDLEDALEAAHDQALQVQLGRDAQVHLLLQRVVVRDKRLGVGAARDGVQHGRLDLEEAVAHHELAQAAHGLAAGYEALAGVLVGDQVHIALAVLLLLVGHAVELVGQRAQALGEQAQAGHLDRQLARLGLHQRAFGAQDVAQVPVLERGIQVFAHGVAGHVKLDAAAHLAQRAVLDRGEAGLAHHALEHHAAGHRYGDWRGLQRFIGGFAVVQVQLRRLVDGLEVVREGDAAARGLGLAQRTELLAALGDELVVVLGGGGGLVVGHRRGRRYGTEMWGAAGARGWGRWLRVRSQTADFMGSAPCGGWQPPWRPCAR